MHKNKKVIIYILSVVLILLQGCQFEEDTPAESGNIISLSTIHQNIEYIMEINRTLDFLFDHEKIDTTQVKDIEKTHMQWGNITDQVFTHIILIDNTNLFALLSGNRVWAVYRDSVSQNGLIYYVVE